VCEYAETTGNIWLMRFEEVGWRSKAVTSDAIYAQSILRGLSFFMWSYERNAPIVPGTLKESVLLSAPRLEFISR